MADRCENAREGFETARIDKPLEDDVIGNAIPGLLVGGMMSSFEAAAREMRSRTAGLTLHARSSGR